MANFEFNGKSIYIDNRLKLRLDNKVIPDLKKRDKDVVFIVDGKERTGKSKFSDGLGAYAAFCLNSHYDLDSVCMTPDEFRNKIMSANKNDVVIYDEAHRGMGSRRALSEINNILIDLMMEMGQKNLFIIIVLPTFFMLDRYPALYRARGLFHIYERRKQRGFWVYFNEKNKQRLFLQGKKFLTYNCMKWPNFRGRFYNQWAINEEEYRLKKIKAFEEKPRVTKAETYMAQRDNLIYLIHKEQKLGSTTLAKLINKYGIALKERIIREILDKTRQNAKKKGIGGAEIVYNTLNKDNNQEEGVGEEEKEGEETEI